MAMPRAAGTGAGLSGILGGFRGGDKDSPKAPQNIGKGQDGETDKVATAQLK